MLTPVFFGITGYALLERQRFGLLSIAPCIGFAEDESELIYPVADAARDGGKRCAGRSYEIL